MKLIWDETKSDSLNFLVLRPKIIDRAILKGQLFAMDDFGMAYDTMSDADFLILAGHAAMIRPPAGPAHGVAAALTNWKPSRRRAAVRFAWNLRSCFRNVCWRL